MKLIHLQVSIIAHEGFFFDYVSWTQDVFESLSSASAGMAELTQLASASRLFFSEFSASTARKLLAASD